jgi:hypothetical protein
MATIPFAAWVTEPIVIGGLPLGLVSLDVTGIAVAAASSETVAESLTAVGGGRLSTVPEMAGLELFH